MGHQRVVGDAHDVAARVAIGRAEREQLLKEHVVQIALLGEHASGGGGEGFVLANEAAGQREGSRERVLVAAQQERVQRALAQGEQGDVDRQVRVAEGVEGLSDRFHARSIYAESMEVKRRRRRAGLGVRKVLEENVLRR